MTQASKEDLALDLYMAMEQPSADHFNAQLFRLFNKSDSIHRARLGKGFPDHYEIYKEWLSSNTAHDFYQRYDVRERYVPPEQTVEGMQEVPEDVRELLEDLGSVLQSVVDQYKPGHGFALFIFDFGPNGSMHYVSNSDREGMSKALSEFLEKQDAGHST